MAELRPPQHISDDGHEVWDWAARFSDHTQRLHDISALSQQIHNMKTQCGNCSQWMTSSCPKERRDNQGRKTGPSSGATKCERFVQSDRAAASLAEHEKE